MQMDVDRNAPAAERADGLLDGQPLSCGRANVRERGARSGEGSRGEAEGGHDAGSQGCWW